MSDSIVSMLLLQILLIVLNAVFASAEIAVISMNDAKLAALAAQGDRRAVRLARLTSQPARFLATIQVAITLSGFLGSAFAADNFSGSLVDWMIQLGLPLPEKTLDTIAVVCITLILSYFTLVFGELVPKRVAMYKAEALALGISGLIDGISRLFAPLVWLLTASTNAILRLLGIDPNAQQDEVGEEEIRMMVDVGSEKGTIEHQEKEFIQNVFEFNDIMAESIATHRTDVVMLWMEDDMEVWAETIHNSRHTFYPVCDGSPDNVIGVLNAKDYFRIDDKSRNKVMNQAVYPAYFVLETTKADVLFRNMKANKNAIAIIIDEHGGMTGIVTMNDLVEELVGDLNDDTEDAKGREPYVEKAEEHTWLVHGNPELEVIEDALGIEIASEGFDTLSGLIFQKLGVIPEDGTQNIELEMQGMQIHITCIREHQIEETVIKIL